MLVRKQESREGRLQSVSLMLLIWAMLDLYVHMRVCVYVNMQGLQTAGASPTNTNSTSLSTADRSQLTLARIRRIITSAHRLRWRHVWRHDDVTVRDTAASRFAGVVVDDALSSERTELPVTWLWIQRRSTTSFWTLTALINVFKLCCVM